MELIWILCRLKWRHDKPCPESFIHIHRAKAYVLHTINASVTFNYMSTSPLLAVAELLESRHDLARGDLKDLSHSGNVSFLLRLFVQTNIFLAHRLTFPPAFSKTSSTANSFSNFFFLPTAFMSRSEEMPHTERLPFSRTHSSLHTEL
jgi:hypothetical protein